ncbi:MAG: FeoB-associated Cys-rich membrane protein [Lachnospiraceae bacterium]|nr:FeoB-associated Cys-rich membrane protein [Lachnospiraceae bacterium]
MVDFVIAGIVILILLLAVVYIRKEKRKGIQCIGCPDAPRCASTGENCAGCSGNCQSSK